MLSPADVISAKLLVQMELCAPDAVRAAMRTVAATPAGAPDVVGQLEEEDLLARTDAARVRRFGAMFEHVRLEAVYLRTVESRRPELDSEGVSELLAQLELSRYRRRLGQVLIEGRALSNEEAIEIERLCRNKLQREDLRVLERYRGEDFAGVARPLLPVPRVHTGVFRVTTLFRSKDTLRRVKQALVRLEEAEQAPEAAHEPGIAAYSGADEGEHELEPDELASHRAATTSRFRAEDLLDEEPNEDLAGRQAIGLYEVVECVGQGGMGAVYLAREEGLGPMVAVKVTHTERAAPEDLARFEREASLMGRVDHEKVVRLMDQGQTEDGLRYMVMPFYAGKDLKDVLDECEGPLPLERTLDVVCQLLAGLQAVHDAGVVHRDLKPENLFVLAGEEGEVRLVDFGIARLADRDVTDPQPDLFRSRSGVISGSPAYVAPETITGDPIDGRTDLYSFGIMLYSMFTGRFPLFAETPYDYLREHLVGVPLTLFQGRRDLGWHAGLEELVASLLAKEPAERPASAASVRDWLLRYRDEILAAAARGPEEPEEETKSFFDRIFKR